MKYPQTRGVKELQEHVTVRALSGMGVQQPVVGSETALEPGGVGVGGAEVEAPGFGQGRNAVLQESRSGVAARGETREEGAGKDGDNECAAPHILPL